MRAHNGSFRGVCKWDRIDSPGLLGEEQFVLAFFTVGLDSVHGRVMCHSRDGERLIRRNALDFLKHSTCDTDRVPTALTEEQFFKILFPGWDYDDRV